MMSAGGFAFLLACVFGSFAIEGGNLMSVLEALPFEMMTIGGAAIGSFAMANSMHVVKASAGGLKMVLSGSRYHESDYVELLSLLYKLLRLVGSKGVMAVERHVEAPQESDLFLAHPKLLRDTAVVSLICDYFRMIGMNADNPYQIEDLIGRELKKRLAENMHPVHSLQTMSDGLPALGIVAAVLGVIKTMSHINERPAVLGAMIGSALTGTFLGVLLAYGLVGPLAARLKQVVEEEARYFEVVRATLIAHLHGNAPQLAVETGRKMVPSEYMPTFNGLEASLDQAAQAR